MRNKKIYEESIKEFEIAKTKNLPSKLEVDDINFQIAYTYHLMNKKKEALQIYSELYQRHPNSLNVTKQYLFTLLLVDEKESFELLQQIVSKIAIDDPFLKLIKSMIAKKLKDYDTEYNILMEIRDDMKNDPLFNFNLGVNLALRGFIQEALISFQYAIHVYKDLYEAWLNGGYILETFYNQPASQFYLKAEQICPNNINIILAKQKSRKRNKIQLIEWAESMYLIKFPSNIAIKFIDDVPNISHELLGIDSSHSVLSFDHKSLFS